MSSRLTALSAVLAIAGCAAFPIGTYEAEPVGADIYRVQLTTGRADTERHDAEFAKRILTTCRGAPKQVSDKRTIWIGVCSDCDTMKLSTTATIICESATA